MVYPLKHGERKGVFLVFLLLLLGGGALHHLSHLGNAKHDLLKPLCKCQEKRLLKIMWRICIGFV